MTASPRNRKLAGAALMLGLLGLSTSAGAHPGDLLHNLSNHAFSQGLLHPLTGFDHLFAMLSVGVWAAMTHGSLRKALWAPVSFVVLLLVGAVLGIAGLRLPFVEPLIMASLLVLGLLVATRLQLPTAAGNAVVGFLALFHGLAHGSELPGGTETAWTFVAGFTLMTAALHFTGMLLGFQLKKRDQWLARIAGGGVFAYGVSLLTGVAAG